MRKQRERDHARRTAQTANERDKLPHSREVPVNAKEWQLAETPKKRESIKIKADEHQPA